MQFFLIKYCYFEKNVCIFKISNHFYIYMKKSALNCYIYWACYLILPKNPITAPLDSRNHPLVNPQVMTIWLTFIPSKTNEYNGKRPSIMYLVVINVAISGLIRSYKIPESSMCVCVVSSMCMWCSPCFALQTVT